MKSQRQTGDDADCSFFTPTWYCFVAIIIVHLAADLGCARSSTWRTIPLSAVILQELTLFTPAPLPLAFGSLSAARGEQKPRKK